MKLRVQLKTWLEWRRWRIKAEVQYTKGLEESRRVVTYAQVVGGEGERQEGDGGRVRTQEIFQVGLETATCMIGFKYEGLGVAFI